MQRATRSSSARSQRPRQQASANPSNPLRDAVSNSPLRAQSPAPGGLPTIRPIGQMPISPGNLPVVNHGDARPSDQSYPASSQPAPFPLRQALMIRAPSNSPLSPTVPRPGAGGPVVRHALLLRSPVPDQPPLAFEIPRGLNLPQVSQIPSTSTSTTESASRKASSYAVVPVSPRFASPTAAQTNLISKTLGLLTPAQQRQLIEICKSRKRSAQQPGASGSSSSQASVSEAKQSDPCVCPICSETYKEAHVTKCGHTFCHECIIKAIEVNPHCPVCDANVHSDQLAPNFSITEVIAKQHRPAKQVKTDLLEAGKLKTEDVDVRKFFSYKSNSLSLSDINVMLTMLERRKEILTSESKVHQRQILLEFLCQLHKIKQSQKSALDRQVSLLETDIKTVIEDAVGNSPKPPGESSSVPESASASIKSTPRGFNTDVPNNDNLSTAIAAKKARISSHFDELVDIYLDTRNAILYEDNLNDDSMVPDSEFDYEFYSPPDSLRDFAETLTKVSRYHGFRPLATFSYSADPLSNSNIVSSIEFDKDNEFFAIAGVTKKIKLFEYATIIGSSVDIQCPNAELGCGAKISCIGWSNYYKNKLASSDYDGCVNLWDAQIGVKTGTLSEHEKRVWSVDWSNGDPRLFASGSDDTKVKLWSTAQERSVVTLESKANVCCVKFCPKNTFHIAFGSADHCVHYYDFRNPREPLSELVGHKKAVSYVKFVSSDELISASTDSNLKLWDLTSACAIRSFRGHINEKNFVGLATDGEYIACGSENNSLYVYYKKLPKPLFSFKFDCHRNMLSRPTPDDSTEFVSAVAWKKGSPIVVAANSQGSIKILEMI